MTETSGYQRVRLLFPATSALLLALLVAAVVTGTATGSLTESWLRRVGFAPRDLWQLDLARIFTSALVTRGPRILLVALLMTALTAGFVERRAGWRASLAVFWGVHLLTVLLTSVVFTPLNSTLQLRVTNALVTVRDVGPSAGYFGCLGFALVVAGGRSGRFGGLAVLCWLALDTLGVVGLPSPPPQELSADLAHLVAFCLGGLLGFGWRRTSRPRPLEQP